MGGFSGGFSSSSFSSSGMGGQGTSIKTSTVIENGKKVTRTEKTTVDRNGQRVTEVTEETDDGRGHRNRNTYMIEGDQNQSRQPKK